MRVRDWATARCLKAPKVCQPQSPADTAVVVAVMGTSSSAGRPRPRWGTRWVCRSTSPGVTSLPVASMRWTARSAGMLGARAAIWPNRIPTSSLPRRRWLGSSTSPPAMTSSYLIAGSAGLKPRGAGVMAWASCIGRSPLAASAAVPASEAPAAAPAAAEVERMKSRRESSMATSSSVRGLVGEGLVRTAVRWRRPGASAPGRDLGRLGGLGLLTFLDEPLHLVHELGDVLELPVHGGEAHVGHLVELLEMLHHHLAQLLGGDLLLRPLVQLGLDLGHHVVHRLHAHRALLAGLEDGPAELLPVEGLAPVVALDHVGQHVLDVLVGRIAAVALEALAAAADELAVTPHARVHHAVFRVAAEGTFHGRSLSG